MWGVRRRREKPLDVAAQWLTLQTIVKGASSLWVVRHGPVMEWSL